MKWGGSRLMSYTVTLAPKQEQRLKRRSEQTGKPIETVLEELINTLPEAESETEQTWGAKMWAELQAEGFTPIWQDLPESSEELAIRFKAKAEGRSESE